MFVVLQHPFADLRYLIGAASGRLPRPSWPVVELHSDFVRSFGRVLKRQRGGLDEWAGEEVFCRANSALRFPNELRKIALGSGVFTASTVRTQRRFNCHGAVVARVETALELALRTRKQSVSPQADFDKLLQDCAQLPCRVPGTGGQLETQPAIKCSSALGRHYLQASTQRQSAVVTQPWWLCTGTPTLLVQSVGQPLPLPRHAQFVLDLGAIRVSHWWRKFGTIQCSVWFLEARRPDRDTLWRLRLHLLRLHAERECLRQVITQILRGTFDWASSAETSELTQQYLNEAIHAIERPERFGIPQSPLLDAARQAVDGAIPGASTTLNQMRRQIAAKVERYIEQSQRSAQIVTIGGKMNTVQIGNFSVTGDFNVTTAQNIKDSFNKASAAGVSTELKEKLQTLAVEVGKLAAQLPKDEAERVSQDLQTLTSEATAKQPRKKWYELSAEGLVEAAKTVGQMAAPISIAVKEVLKLLEQTA